MRATGPVLSFVLAALLAAGGATDAAEADRGWASQQDLAGRFEADGCLELPYHQTVIGAELPGEYCVVLFLHGAGERGGDNARHLIFGYEPMVSFCVANRVKAILLFPQCPRGSQWSTIKVPGIDPPLSPSPAPPLASAMLLLQTKIAEFAPKKVYAVGISMGGYGVWDLLARYPGFFSAAMAICGGGDATRACDLVDTPIYAAHGSDDILVPAARSRSMVKAIWQAGGDKITYQEFPLVGHDVWNRVFADETVWNWLFLRGDKTAKRPSPLRRLYPVPKVFPWQNRLF